MRHLLSFWEDIALRLSDADRIILLSDFDGTLSPIVDRPEQAYISESTRLLLQTLTERPGTSVAIVSGRSLTDLKERVGLENLTYAGNHGLEIEGPAFSFVEPVSQKSRPMLDQLHRFLRQSLAPFRGVIVEHKGLTLTVHYRMVEARTIEEFKSLFEQIADSIRSIGRLRVTSGKKVHEVRPAVSWDKGTAISLLLNRYDTLAGDDRSVAIFLGDDVTDEDGFKVLRQSGGISVFVGDENKHSAGEYFLRSPVEVQEFLRRLAEVPNPAGRPGC